MRIDIPFLSKPVEIDSVIVGMRKKIHTLPGLKVGKKFTYRLRFTNTDDKTMRVLGISVAEPFALLRVDRNLPIDIGPGKREVFGLDCSIGTDYRYRGPMRIDLEAMPIT